MSSEINLYTVVAELTLAPVTGLAQRFDSVDQSLLVRSR